MEVIRAADYRVLYSDAFDLAISNEGVRLQILQRDPDEFIACLAGVQLPYETALALSEAIRKAVEKYEESSGIEIPRPSVSVREESEASQAD
jgi:hypothetical protein